MKALVISILLFCLVLGGIVLNALFVHRTVTKMEQILLQLEETDDQETLLSDLEAYWDQQKKLLSLSISFRDLDHAEETLVGLRWAYNEQDEKEFRKYHALLLDAVEELARIEKLSIENLF